MHTVIFCLRSLLDEAKLKHSRLSADRDAYINETDEQGNRKLAFNGLPRSADNWFNLDTLMEVEHRIKMLEAIIRDVTPRSHPLAQDADYWNAKMKRDYNMK